MYSGPVFQPNYLPPAPPPPPPPPPPPAQQQPPRSYVIRGLARVESKYIRGVVATAVREIANEPDNFAMRAKVAEYDGSYVLVFTGLTTVVAKQLDPVQWNLAAELRHCVVGVEYDVKAKQVCVKMRDVSTKSTQPPPAAALESESQTTAPPPPPPPPPPSTTQADADDEDEDEDEEDDDVESALTPARLGDIRLVVPAAKPQQQQRRQTSAAQKKPAKKASFEVDIAISPDVAPALAHVPETMALSPISAREKRIALVVTKDRKEKLPSVARCVAWLTSAVGRAGGPLSVVASIHVSKRNPATRSNWTITIGGFDSFDWRLLAPTAWPTLYIPNALRTSFEASFDVETSRLIVQMGPPGLIETIYESLEKAFTRRPGVDQDAGDEEIRRKRAAEYQEQFDEEVELYRELKRPRKQNS